MIRFKTPALLSLLSLIVLLPLYELADYAEQWAHDGTVVGPLLLILSLAALSLAMRRLMPSTLSVTQSVDEKLRFVGAAIIPSCRPQGVSNTLFLLLCDFRI